MEAGGCYPRRCRYAFPIVERRHPRLFSAVPDRLAIGLAGAAALVGALLASLATPIVADAEVDWHGAQWITPEAATEAAAWSNYRVDVDFTIAEGAAGVIFRAQSPSDYYMWQVNISDGEILLRPHVFRDGHPSVLDEIDIEDVISPSEAHAEHHLTIEADGDEIVTLIDGEQVDELDDDTFSTGGVGFRSGDGSEDASFDQLEVHDLEGDGQLFADDFSTSPDPAFPGAEIGGGALRARGGQVDLISTAPPVPQLRRSFDLDQPAADVASAHVYAFGLGFYELRLSGQRVGDRVLTPPATSYDHRLRYQTYDVTSQLQGGENVLGMTLAEGYGPNFSKYGWRWLGPREARVLLEVSYENGDTQRVVSDDSWRWNEGPVRNASIYAGETYDARLAGSGWDEPGFDDDDWGPVKTATPPGGTLEADRTPPIRVVETLHPVALTEPEPGVAIFDLGRNVSGWARIHVHGPEGTEVRMRYAEELEPDGTLDTTTNRNAAATDAFILADEPGEQTFEPEFTYHGFRYVEVTGLPGSDPPALSMLEGRVVRADVEQTATFESSDPMLDRIYANNRRTMENNMVSYPTDNPVRDERTGPGMDVQAYGDAAVRDFDVDDFFSAYLDQLDEEWGGSPDMNSTHVPLAWSLYKQYGDQAALVKAYPEMTAAVDSYMTEADDGVWPEPGAGEHDGFGDWCPPLPADEVGGGLGSDDPDFYEECFSEVSLVNTALAYRDARIVAAAATALGHGVDATHFEAVAAQIEAGFEAAFANPGGGYGSERQVTSILPLAFGMVPEARREAVGQALVDRILGQDEGHLDTGIFGTRFLLDALVAAGRPDVALTVLDQKTYPGFGYEIGIGEQLGLGPGHGATTDWEEWAYHSGSASHDHAMFAGINASFLTKLAGIEPTAPGYAAIRIAPVLAGSLEHAAATMQTVHGEVASSWRRTGSEIDLDVTVPTGTTAEVQVPTRPGYEVLESGVPAGESPGVSFVREEGEVAVYDVVPGSYGFVAAEPHAEVPGGGDGGSGAQNSAGSGPAAAPPPIAPKPIVRPPRPRLRIAARGLARHRIALTIACRAGCPAGRRTVGVTVASAAGRHKVLARAHVRLVDGHGRLTLAPRGGSLPARLRVTVTGLGGDPLVSTVPLALSAPS